MGEVVMTYKVNPHTDVEDVDPEAIAETIRGFADDVYDVQAVEIKPLAFGLRFVQVHVKMNDGPGLKFTAWAKSKSSRWASFERRFPPDEGAPHHARFLQPR